MDDLEARLDRVESTLAIQRLMHEFCRGFDRRDMDRFLAVWHDDARWVSPRATYQGKADISDGVVTRMWPNYRSTRHWMVNIVVDVDVDSDRATAYSELTSQNFPLAAPEQVLMVASAYHDEFVREQGVWTLKRRETELLEFVSVGMDTPLS